MVLQVIFLFLFVIGNTQCEVDLPHAYSYEPKNNSFVKNYVKLPSDARSLSPTFLKDRPADLFRFQSQAGQDQMILQLFNDKSDGYFVDLAANHWQKFSNTYVLEQYNKWKGVCIEPNPEYITGLLANRRCTVITSPVSRTKGDIVKFRFHDNGPFGGIVGEGMDNTGEEADRDHFLATTTLTDILGFVKAPRVMDYLSLDVEGAEHLVLQGLDASRYFFRVVTIERPKPHSHHLLAKAGYRFVYQMSDFGECMYFHQIIDNYSSLMHKYHQSKVPAWTDVARPYLLHPKWNEKYTGHGQDFTNK